MITELQNNTSLPSRLVTIQNTCGSFSTGICNPGYFQASPNYNYWSCGDGCVGGKYYTDLYCHCICKTCQELLGPTAMPTLAPTLGPFVVPNSYSFLNGK